METFLKHFFENNKPNKDNIFMYLKYNKITEKELDNIVDYQIIINFGYMILGNFGSNYYNNLKKIVIDKKINECDDCNETEINNIINYEVLINNKETIINKFGIDYYNYKIKNYRN